MSMTETVNIRRIKPSTLHPPRFQPTFGIIVKKYTPATGTLVSQLLNEGIWLRIVRTYVT